MDTSGSRPRAYLSLVLHAHLPHVRDPEHERFLEEQWFYEALLETYLPLLLGLEGLVRDGVDFRLTLGLTPTLLELLADDLLRDRFERRLDGLLELCRKEVARHRGSPELLEVLAFYVDRLERLRELYLVGCRRDVTEGFRRLQDLGRVEIIASAATHGLLPVLAQEPSSARAQVRIGIETYHAAFGRRPQGFWLPECAYAPGIDELLAEEGIRYFFLESHGVLNASTRARRGVYAPVICPSGVAAFARDPECSRQVWSSEEGFPGHPDYREFYWDVGFEAPLEVVGPHIGADNLRTHTGIKYRRVTGRTDHKDLYVRERALHRAAEHARVFLGWRRAQAAWLKERLDRPPIIVAPFDAELFGHWWFEGPEWLCFLLRGAAALGDELVMATPSEYLADFPVSQRARPSPSTWGAGGYLDHWLNGATDEATPRILEASRRMGVLAREEPGATGIRRRALNQAARELLLAQASDWPFILKSGTATQYARARLVGHIAAFDALTAVRDERGADAAGLGRLEARNNLFPDLDYEVFGPGRAQLAGARRATPRHVAFLSAEAAPFVKVGGLADVAGALPRALAALGVRVTVVLPAYRAVDREAHQVEVLREGLCLPSGRKRTFRLLEARSPAGGVRVLLVDLPDLFDREGVYVDPATGKEPPDAAERFLVFTLAALVALREVGDPVDVIHSHDHHTALAPAFLTRLQEADPILGHAATVYTIHNLGYQGIFPAAELEHVGIPVPQNGEASPFLQNGALNLMQAGILLADRISTVSEGYAREILSGDAAAAGLKEALALRRQDLVGILNGIDVETWNPSTDPHLPRPYSVDDLSGKAASRRALLQRFRLSSVAGSQPVVGMISRLVDQKGLDLLQQCLGRLLDLGIALVVLGTGLPKYEELLGRAARGRPGQIGVELRFDEPLSHLIEAGADLFLMPSLYEPCGLNQLYSLRYGTVPVVRATGGLADTVVDDDSHPGRGNGFAFLEYRPEALLDAVARARAAYLDPERWRGIQLRGMTADPSWERSALKYLELYRGAMAAHKH